MSDEKNKLKLYEKALCDECVDGPMGACVNACVNKALTHDPRKGYEADCVLRILDWAGREGIDLDEILKLKHEYNKTRPYRHGGKRL